MKGNDLQRLSKTLPNFHKTTRSCLWMLSFSLGLAPKHPETEKQKTKIQQTAAVAASERSLDPENQTYHVLMIVTDGVINDMANTMDALVAAADLPFSVIM